MGENESPFPLKENVRNAPPKCSERPFQVPAFKTLTHLRSDLQNLEQLGNVDMADYFGKNIFSPLSKFVLSKGCSTEMLSKAL